MEHYIKKLPKSQYYRYKFKPDSTKNPSFQRGFKDSRPVKGDVCKTEGFISLPPQLGLPPIGQLVLDKDCKTHNSIQFDDRI